MKITSVVVGRLGTNCYLISDDHGETVVLDPGDEAARILDIVKQHQGRVAAVLLSHTHFDHMMAVSELLEVTGAPLLVPREDADGLNDAHRNLTRMVGCTLPPMEATRLLDEGDEVAVGDIRLRVMHTPGHTPGSSCYVSDRIIFSGDTLFAGSIGRTDFPGGDHNVLRRSLERLAALEGDYTVYPGHDERTTLDRERRYNPFL